MEVLSFISFLLYRLTPVSSVVFIFLAAMKTMDWLWDRKE